MLGTFYGQFAGKQTHAGHLAEHGRAGPAEPTFQRHLDPTGENA